MVSEDDEFERLWREKEMKRAHAKTNRSGPAEEQIDIVYSLRLTRTQRISLLRLGGPTWLRAQIDQSTTTDAAAELRRLQSVNAELLAALKGLKNHVAMSGREQIELERFVKVAIAKAERTST